MSLAAVAASVFAEVFAAPIPLARGALLRTWFLWLLLRDSAFASAPLVSLVVCFAGCLCFSGCLLRDSAFVSAPLFSLVVCFAGCLCGLFAGCLPGLLAVVPLRCLATPVPRRGGLAPCMWRVPDTQAPNSMASGCALISLSGVQKNHENNAKTKVCKVCRKFAESLQKVCRPTFEGF